MKKNTNDTGYPSQLPRGAVYIPSRAYNAYQMWRDYSESETTRDMGFAKSISLNALRIWVSYDYWLENKDKFKISFDHFIHTAHHYGIRIMPSLFEDCGRDNSVEAFSDRNPLTAVAVKSPGRKVEQDPELWEEPGRYVQWFMENYKDNERLLAIEIMNEPHTKAGNLPFSLAMLKHANKMKGSVPLTMGCIKLEHNLYYANHGLDIYQLHHNFPVSEEDFENTLRQAKEVEKMSEKPVWITEWQRIRRKGPGWDVKQLDKDDITPNLSSLAQIVKEINLGNFFWSLMVKPAYLMAQRPNGTFNGIFHEDGAVYSLNDARAVSGNPNFNALERDSLPEWYQTDMMRHIK